MQSEGIDVEPILIGTATKALAHLREAHDLLRERRIAHHHAWFLCVMLASAFKDVLKRGADKDNKPDTPLKTIVREVLERRLEDDLAVIIRLTRNSLAHNYMLCYTRDHAVFAPGVFAPGVFVEETFTGAPGDGNKRMGRFDLKKGQIEAGPFLDRSPTEIVELAVAWCEQVMAEIEREAQERGVSLA